MTVARCIRAALVVAVASALPAVPGARATHPAESGGFWVAGDLHAHSTYSHDSYGGPEDDNTGFDEVWTLGHPVQRQFEIAAARGLDFLAITDHNDVRSQSDAGWGAGGVVGLPAYENSLRGHAQMLGAERVYGGPSDTASVRALSEQLREDGGVFQVNHPAGDTVDGSHLDWTYSCDDVPPDTVEVWNINAAWQPPMPSGNSIDLAIAFWEGCLDSGHEVAATGGSDNHWVSTTAVQGVGQPTTWVFVEELTVEAVLEGLRDGHTFVSHQPPAHAGPLLHLEADEGRDGTFEAIAGDRVDTGARFRVRVEGAPGSVLRVFRDGGVLHDEVVVDATSFVHEFDAQEATWVRAELVEPDAAAERRGACDAELGDQTTYCRDRVVMLALTSPIYLGPEDA